MAGTILLILAIVMVVVVPALDALIGEYDAAREARRKKLDEERRYINRHFH